MSGVSILDLVPAQEVKMKVLCISPIPITSGHMKTSDGKCCRRSQWVEFIDLKSTMVGCCFQPARGRQRSISESNTVHDWLISSSFPTPSIAGSAL